MPAAVSLRKPILPDNGLGDVYFETAKSAKITHPPNHFKIKHHPQSIFVENWLRAVVVVILNLRKII